MSDQPDTRQAAWRKKLDSDSEDHRIDALRQISTAEEVHGLTASIVTMAGSDDDEIRMWASEALESAVQPDASEQLMLIQLLESTHDSEICYWAATMLGRLGKEAGAAAAALEVCVRESMYLPARERAAWALSQIGPAAKVATATLKEAAETAPPRLQRLATAALEAIENPSQNVADDSDVSEEAA